MSSGSSSEKHESKVIVFYDGDCGMCHGLVRFMLPRDKSQNPINYSPINSETWKARSLDTLPLPDSIVVIVGEERPIVESRAVLFLLSRIGSIWRVFSAVSRIVPNFLRNIVYRFIARNRKRFFKTPTGLCPVVPEDLRERFLP